MRVDCWTDEDLSKLKEYAAAGLSASRIGIRLNRTRNAVLGKLFRIGQPLPQKHDSRWTKILGLAAWAMAERGEGNQVIAEQLGNGITAKDVAVKVNNMRQQKRLRSERQVRYKAAKPRPPVVAHPLPRRRIVRLPVAPQPIGVRYLDLQPHQCKWPLGGDYDRPEFWCGAPAESDSVPYCSPHCAMAYRPTDTTVRPSPTW